MTTDRIKEIQAETAYPNSTSVQQALLKVWNECQREQVKNCSIPDAVKSFGCGWNFCDAVLDKKGVVKCGKCNRYE